MSDHSVKRQRLDSDGRYSPASPPFHLAAKANETKQPIHHPRTPTSPPYPSMSSQPNGGSAVIATSSMSATTPASSLNMSQQHSQSASSASNPHPFPTPSSTTGGVSSNNIDSDGDAMMEYGVGDDAARVGGHRLSNHNRQTRVIFSENGGVKAAEGIRGDQLFNLCQNTHEIARPHGSQNLFKLYGLEPLARSVARTDPNTGEKINKLRKSYEGHIKALQIAGKPKAVKMEKVFTEVLAIPDAEYHILKVSGKEIGNALNPERTGLSSRLDTMLNSAFAGMGPGPLPSADTARFRAYLGTDDSAKAKPTPDGAPHRIVPPTSASTPNSASAAAAAAARAVRPERAGAKRQYTDASFHGYGEGYADDYGADSTGGEDNTQGNLANKRRKLFERPSHSVEVGGVRR